MDVTVIIPTYNRLWCLPKAIDSCFNTHLNIEVMVIDDGSTDGTLDYLETKPNLTVFHQQNQGKDVAINNFFERAKGKYIRFLDSDDWHLPYSTDHLVEEAISKNATVVAAGYDLYTEEEVYIKTIDWINCDDFIAQQLGECDSSHYSAYLFEKSFITHIPHRQEFGSRDDRMFILEIALKNPMVSFINKSTLAHRIHQQEKLQKDRGIACLLNNIAYARVFQTALQELEKQGTCTKRRQDAASQMIWEGTKWVANQDIKEALTIFSWLKNVNPTFKITDTGFKGNLYRFLGFKATSLFLNFIRSIKIK